MAVLLVGLGLSRSCLGRDERGSGSQNWIVSVDLAAMSPLLP